MSVEAKKEIISWIKTIVFAIVFAFFISRFVIVNASVPTGSMQATIQEGDRILALRLFYLFTEPERFDVVVFKYPDDESVLFVKRIIGLPGETVQIIDGKVYINNSDTPLDNTFVNGTPYGDYGPVVVPESSYFMLGDNRNNSRDSRYWENTFVKEEKILGKVLFKYYPSLKTIK